MNCVELRNVGKGPYIVTRAGDVDSAFDIVSLNRIRKSSDGQRGWYDLEDVVAITKSKTAAYKVARALNDSRNR